MFTETEEGFVKLYSKKVTTEDPCHGADPGVCEGEDPDEIPGPRFQNLRQLLKVILWHYW